MLVYILAVYTPASPFTRRSSASCPRCVESVLRAIFHAAFGRRLLTRMHVCTGAGVGTTSSQPGIPGPPGPRGVPGNSGYKGGRGTTRAFPPCSQHKKRNKDSKPLVVRCDHTVILRFHPVRCVPQVTPGTAPALEEVLQGHLGQSGCKEATEGPATQGKRGSPGIQDPLVLMVFKDLL